MIGLVRGWAVDWLSSHDPRAAEEVLDPEYRLTIGSVVLEGRDAYLAGTLGQLGNYPGLVLTVHEVIVGEDLAAVWFTEHGTATHREGALAAWQGVVIHRRDGDRLVESWAEEDYASRSRQLSGGVPQDIGAAAIAPWDAVPAGSDLEAERAVREWLESGAPSSGTIRFDDGTGTLHESGSPRAIEVHVLFSSGPHVAFHGSIELEAGLEQGIGGLIAVREDGTLSGQVVTDRAGVQAARKRRG